MAHKIQGTRDALLEILKCTCEELASGIIGTAEINDCVVPVLAYDNMIVTTVKISTLLSVTIEETPITEVTKLTIGGDSPLHFDRSITTSFKLNYGPEGKDV